MTKLIAITLAAFALTACGSMYGTGTGTMGNTSATKNSPETNKSGNPAAVSPGSGAK